MNRPVERAFGREQLSRLEAAVRLSGATLRTALEDPDLRARKTIKADGSPVTWADLASEAILLRFLPIVDPETAVLSEEGRRRPEHLGDEPFWWIDPLDATREFIKGNAGHFCVTLARMGLGDNGAVRPQLGLVFDPVSEICVLGGDGVPPHRRHPDKGTSELVAPGASQPTRIIDNGSTRCPLIEDLRAALGVPENGVLARGSALKILDLANHPGSFYARPTPQKEWDWAGLTAIARAAGFIVTDFIGDPLRFGTPEGILDQGILVCPPDLFETVNQAARTVRARAPEDAMREILK